MEILLSFVTSHLCENDISAVTVVKTKYPSRLVIEKELTIKIVISLMTQRFRKFVLKKNRANKLLFQKEYILYFFYSPKFVTTKFQIIICYKEQLFSMYIINYLEQIGLIEISVDYS